MAALQNQKVEKEEHEEDKKFSTEKDMENCFGFDVSVYPLFTWFFYPTVKTYRIYSNIEFVLSVIIQF